MRVYQYKSGVMVETSDSYVGTGLCKLRVNRGGCGGNIRGKIEGFSAKSAQRLRKMLCRLDFESVYSITLTLPKCDIGLDFRALWHSFVIRVRRALPNIAIIWRIELQQREVPHWHLIAITSDYFRCFDIKQLWFDSVRSWHSEIITAPFFLHGVKICNYTLTSGRTINYFSSHVSKHKKSQLGWQGRQWGVINRSAVRFSPCSEFVVAEDVEKQVVRQLRRLSDNLRKYHRYGNIVSRGRLRPCLFGINQDRLNQVLSYYCPDW